MIRIIALVATVFALAACETTEGFGRDVKSVGQAIEDEAEG